MLNLSQEEWFAVYEAVTQYVQNCEDLDEVQDIKELKHFAHARDVMERMDAALIRTIDRDS